MNPENDTVERTCFEHVFCSLFQATFLCGAKESEVGPEMLYNEN